MQFIMRHDALHSGRALRLLLIGVAVWTLLSGCSKRDESDSSAGASGAGRRSEIGTEEKAVADASAWTTLPRGAEPLNLILITLDTTRRDRLSCYGYSKETTPNLDRLAADGVLFDQAFTPVPLTLPSHATMMTGLYPFQHGVRHNGSYVLTDSLTTLAEMLRAKGYDTGAAVGAFPVDHRFGLAQGFDEYDDRFPPASAAREGDTAQRRAPEVTRLSLEWIDRHAGRPFFLWAHYFDPHAPYHPQEPFASRFPGDPYGGEIASMDAAIGALLEGVESRGLSRRTLFLVAGDHGEGLGDHEEPTHSLFLYGATQAVPLLMRFPDADPWAGKGWRARRVEGQAGLIDLLPTAWNALGFEQGELPPMAGRSLLPMIEGTASGHEWLYHETLAPDLDFGMSELRGLQVIPWKYIRAPQPELYDLRNDPGELVNLAAREKERVQAMESRLAEILQAEKPAYAPMAMDQETVEKLHALGYLQGGSPPSRADRADPKEQSGVGKATARAQSLAEASRVEEAVAVLDSILAAHPETRMALRLRAQYLLRLERGPEAIEAYASALADCRGCPDEFRLLQEQASAYLVSGRADEALRRTRVLLDARPREEGLHLLLGEILEKSGDTAGARKSYEQESELFPLEALSLVKLGNLHLATNRIGEAEQVYRKALGVNPESIDALVMLSELLDKSGRRGESEQLADRALALQPGSSAAHHRKAWLLRESGRKEEAVPHFQRAVQGQPDNASLLYELGSLYGELGRNGEATGCYEKAARTGQAPAGVYANLAVLAAQGGRYQEAIALWRQALDRKPSASETDVIRANIRKAEDLVRGSAAKGR